MRGIWHIKWTVYDLLLSPYILTSAVLEATQGPQFDLILKYLNQKLPRVSFQITVPTDPKHSPHIG
jgi:hypothetical protein